MLIPADAIEAKAVQSRQHLRRQPAQRRFVAAQRPPPPRFIKRLLLTHGRPSWDSARLVVTLLVYVKRRRESFAKRLPKS
jgi:hypothetical protein